MNDTKQIADSICHAVTVAQCLWEWDNVNDPPCHPDDEGWKGCSSCYANREILAIAFHTAANDLGSHLLSQELRQIANYLESSDPNCND